LDEIQASEVRDWLTKLQGPGAEVRDEVIARMRSAGSSTLFPILSRFLEDPDCEIRCIAAEAIFHIDGVAGVPLLLPLLGDPEWVVRVEICGLMHDIADRRAVQALIHAMKTDPNPMVRNTATYGLGGIGDPVAIPALIETLDTDHELDELGHTAGGCAATALDNILQTNHTRIRLADGLCTVQPRKTDLDMLKQQAMELYRSL